MKRAELAAKYGISRNHVGVVLNRFVWKHDAGRGGNPIGESGKADE